MATRRRRTPPTKGEEHYARSPVARDRDHIIHSSALRRLPRKSQSNDLFRTRPTHTLECAQIGRAIAFRAKESDDVDSVVEQVTSSSPGSIRGFVLSTMGAPAMA